MYDKPDEIEELLKKLENPGEAAVLAKVLGGMLRTVIRRTLDRRVRQREDSEDIAQNVFLALADSAATCNLENPEELRAFLSQLAHHKAVDANRPGSWEDGARTPSSPQCERLAMQKCFYSYFLVVYLLSYPATLFAQAQVGQEFKSKVLAKWKSLLPTINTASWEERIEYSRDPKHLQRGGVTVLKRAFKRDTGSEVSEERQTFDDKMKVAKRHRVYVTNLQYSFELTRPTGRDGWLLSALKQDSKHVGTRDDFRFPWMTIGNMDLDQWLRQPGLVFSKIEQLPGTPTSGFSRAHFEYNGTRDDWSDGIKTGYIDFDPTHFYRPLSYRFQIKSTVREGTEWGTLALK